MAEIENKLGLCSTCIIISIFLTIVFWSLLIFVGPAVKAWYVFAGLWYFACSFLLLSLSHLLRYLLLNRQKSRNAAWDYAQLAHGPNIKEKGRDKWVDLFVASYLFSWRSRYCLRTWSVRLSHLSLAVRASASRFWINLTNWPIAAAERNRPPSSKKGIRLSLEGLIRNQF